MKTLLSVTLFFYCLLFFGQKKEVNIDLSYNKNRRTIVSKDSNLHVQIYPELSRNGEYTFINNNNKTLYSHIYQEVDFVTIDFSSIVDLKTGKYTLKFISDAYEVETIKIKIK